jgi:predicted acylesterase/phospholipase RssA
MTTADKKDTRATMRKTHRVMPRPPFERIALVLQGGGALGAYQAGVYQALAEANLHPDWVAGISIGAVNSALVAGNPPEKRVARPREFWEIVSTAPMGFTYLTNLRTTTNCAPLALCFGEHRVSSRRGSRYPCRSHPRTSIHLAITTLPL